MSLFSTVSASVRIIGGKWRSRRLNFPPVNALRPTPDAVRETLFNWLNLTIEGTRCLDLYAGSGALGFEAISRGAERVVLVEKHRKVVKVLRANKQSIDSDRQIDITNCTALQYISTCDKQFDLIFLDPPFATDELAKASYHINKKGLLKADGLIYIESPSDLKISPVPETWVTLKQAQKRAVRYTLAQFQTRTLKPHLDV